VEKFVGNPWRIGNSRGVSVILIGLLKISATLQAFDPAQYFFSLAATC
jgi:hypothetical protein